MDVLQGELAAVLGHGVRRAAVVQHQGAAGRGGLDASPARPDQAAPGQGPGLGLGCAEGRPGPHIFLFTPRMRLDCTSEMRNWMSCG